MKIIDFEQKGNVVRFYLGDEGLVDWFGDDWDDAPYEHNAGQVYEDYITGHHDLMLPFEYLVLQPSSGTYNSEWSKNDMKERRVPCIIVVPPEQVGWSDSFSHYINDSHVTRYYFGDSMQGD